MNKKWLLCGVLYVCALASAGNPAPLLYIQTNKLKMTQSPFSALAPNTLILSDGDTILEAPHAYIPEKEHLQIDGDAKMFQSGNIIWAKNLIISRDFKNILSPSIRVLTAEDGRLTGKNFDKDGPVATIDFATYSPCKLCKESSSEPTWALKAERIEWDQKSETMDYHDATLDIAGVPVFYWPYLSLPDPTVKRCSGLLGPMLRYGTNYGALVGVPYYFNIAPNKDLTLTPIVTSKAGFFTSLDYRHLLDKGYYGVRGNVGLTTDQRLSGIKGGVKKVYGNVFSSGTYGFTDHWRGNYQIDRVSSKNYVKRFPFTVPGDMGYAPSLVSKIEAEGFYGQNYALIAGYSFQDMRTAADPKLEPLVAPYMYYEYVGTPGAYGNYLTAQMDHLFIYRRRGRMADENHLWALPQKMERVAGSLQWTIPYYTDDGSILQMDLILKGRLYQVWKYKPLMINKPFTGTTGTLLPQARLSWRKPYMGRMGDYRVVVEPITSLVVSPYKDRNDKEPNEDSQDIELDQTTLYLADRFPGQDVLDSGQRFNYGSKFYIFDKTQQRASFFIGQSYSFNEIKTYPNVHLLGIKKGFSDIILDAQLNPSPVFSVQAGMLLDRSNFSPNRSQVFLQAGKPVLRGRVGYVFLKEKIYAKDDAVRRHQIVTTLETNFYQNWYASSTWAYDLYRRGTLSYDVRLGYKDDCLDGSFMILKSYWKDKVVKPGITLMLTLTFKGFGSVTTGSVGQNIPNEIKTLHGLKEIKPL